MLRSYSDEYCAGWLWSKKLTLCLRFDGKKFKKLEKTKEWKQNFKKRKKKIDNLTICLWKQIVGPHVVAL